MSVALLQGIGILQGLSLLSGLDTSARRGVCAPEADIAVVGAGEDVVVVWCEVCSEDSVCEKISIWPSFVDGEPRRM